MVAELVVNDIPPPSSASPKKKKKKSKSSSSSEDKQIELPIAKVTPGEKKKSKKSKRAREEVEDEKIAFPTETVSSDGEKKKKKKSKKETTVAESSGETAAAATPTSSTSSSTTWAYSSSPLLLQASEKSVADYLSKHAVEYIHPSNTTTATATTIRPIMDFKFVNFPSIIQSTLDSLKFTAPTPIQAASWPVVLSNKDLVGIAATGSGKTLSFGIPALIHVWNLKHQSASSYHGNVKRASPSVLVIAPTRELAIQIQNSLVTFAQPMGIKTLCIYGGVAKWEQKNALVEKGGVDIVVCTPGRLMDLVNDDVLTLSKVGVLVLDEADRMLDMGFEKDIKKIVSTIENPDRQTVMFSATWPPQIQSLAMSYMKSPIRVTIGTTDKLAANTSITQHVTVCQPFEKDRHLLALLKKYHASRTNRVLVFILYKKEAPKLEGLLKRSGWSNVRSIHGDMSQAARIESLEAFRDGTCPLLIATDVAARGLDIPNVEYVINYTYPLTTEEYCHRIGRTGRAGKTGISHTLFTVHDKAHSGALINVLKGASQEVPEDLFKFGTTVKKKVDPNYGAFVKEGVDMNQKGTKITFGDNDDSD